MQPCKSRGDLVHNCSTFSRCARDRAGHGFDFLIRFSNSRFVIPGRASWREPGMTKEQATTFPRRAFVQPAPRSVTIARTSLMVARAERSTATDLPDEARENLRFHEFVKTEL